MEKENEIAQRSLKKAPRQHTAIRKPKNRLTETDISRLFRIFRTDYGHAWVSLFDSVEALAEAKARWAEQLGHLTPRQIQHGINIMGRHYRQFPPKLHEFVALCESYGPQKPRHASHEWWYPEPVKRADKSTAATEMANIREVLGNNG